MEVLKRVGIRHFAPVFETDPGRRRGWVGWCGGPGFVEAFFFFFFQLGVVWGGWACVERLKHMLLGIHWGLRCLLCEMGFGMVAREGFAMCVGSGEALERERERERARGWISCEGYFWMDGAARLECLSIYLGFGFAWACDVAGV